MRVESSQPSENVPSRDAPPAAGPLVRRAIRPLTVGSLIVLITAGALWFAIARARPVSLGAVRGVRLGMTPESVRVAFTDRAAGDWSSPPSCCGENLVWTRASVEATPIRWARFEFNQGLLEAIRVLSDPGRGPVAQHIVVTPVAVSEVRPGADGSTSTTVLARRSEMHRVEVRRLIAAAGSSP
jgi:hypothetical protein